MMKTTDKPNYGLDAPGLLRFFFIAGLLCCFGMFVVLALISQIPIWLQVLAGVMAIFALYFFGMGFLMIYDSKVTKILARDHLLNKITWRGDENILDVGCGRGLMLVGAAQKLTTGKVVGIDIWQAHDQSGNTAEAAIENARIMNVSDRVAVQTADMRSLPFSDQSFDVVLSSWAVHNLTEKSDRGQALDEMMRVLKKGGYLMVSDIEHRHVYAEHLVTRGLVNLEIMFSPIRDQILNIVSFGSYRPSAIVGFKPF